MHPARGLRAVLAVTGVAALTIAATAGVCATRKDTAGAAPGEGRGAARVVSRQQLQSTCDEYRDGFASDLRSDPALPHSFAFTRVAYSGGRGRRGGWGRSGWATDAPKADLQFLVVFRRLLGIDSYPCHHFLTLDDPGIFRFPFLYALEVGSMGLSEPEVKNLRAYLLAGGFLMIDDFWGTREWQNFEYEIRQVLPEYEIVELPLDHPIFRTFYEIKEILQVPSIGNARWGQTHESDGYVPHARGILDEKGRVMVMINWNTDIGDAWEWAEQPDYPLKYSTFAYQMGVNFIVYSMSH